MGFNKKYVSIETIQEQIKRKKPLKELFKADGFIFTDAVSTKVFQLVYDGVDEKEIIQFTQNQN